MAIQGWDTGYPTNNLTTDQLQGNFGTPTIAQLPNAENQKEVMGPPAPGTSDSNFIGPVSNIATPVVNTPTPTPTPQPSGVSSENFMDYYPGWGKQEAENDFGASFGGDINKLKESRNPAPSTNTAPAPAPTEYEQYNLDNPYSDITPNWKPEDFASKLNEIYNSAMKYGSEQEEFLRNSNTQNISDLNKSYQEGATGLGTSKEQTLGSLGESQIGARQAQEKGITEATRLYNDLIKGYSQRFGGASSAGGAAAAMANQEAQRSVGSQRQATQNTLRQIETEKNNVEQNYQNKMIELRNQKDSSVNQANQSLQAGLLEISRDRTTATESKALSQMNLLKEYRTQLFNIEQQAKSYEANIASMREQSNIQLQAMIQQNNLSSSTGAGYLKTQRDNTQTPTSDLYVNGGNNQQQQQYTGVKDDDYANFLKGARSYSPSTEEGKLQSYFGTNATFR